MAMNVQEVRFYVLDVGQGACNYVEIVNTSNQIIHNMLVDLGTNSSQAIAAANIEWLKSRIQNRPNPKIDVVLLTHGDNDHYNLMFKLLPALGQPTQQQISLVRFGGVEWRYKIGNTSVIDVLKLYCANVNELQPLATNYHFDVGRWVPLWPSVYDVNDAVLLLIVANTPHPQDGTIKKSASRRPNAEAINSKSLVFGVYWNNYWFVGTGDGTAATLSMVNQGFGAITLPTTMSMTLPHHGSRKTTYDLTNAADIPGDESFKVVTDFLTLFKPWTVSVSADEKRHHHPSLLMMTQFAAATSATSYWQDPYLNNGNHFLVPWIDWNIAKRGAKDWPGQWIYSSVQTAVNVFPTLYCDRSKVVKYQSPPIPAIDLSATAYPVGGTLPPRGRNWVYQSNGTNLQVQSWANDRPQTTRRERFLGASAPVPPARTAATRLAALAEPAPAPVAPAPSPYRASFAGIAPFARPAPPVPPAGAALRRLKVIP